MAKKRIYKTIPLLEVALSLYSAYAAILLFIFPTILEASGAGIYNAMTKIAPQPIWAGAFLVGGLIKAYGLVLDKWKLRRAGLTMSAVLYGTIAICYASVFPNLGFGIFSIMSMMALVSIFHVPRTEL